MSAANILINKFKQDNPGSVSLEILAAQRSVNENLQDPNLPSHIIENVFNDLANTYCPRVLAEWAEGNYRNLVPLNPGVLPLGFTGALSQNDFELCLQIINIMSPEYADEYLQRLINRYIELGYLAPAEEIINHQISDETIKERMRGELVQAYLRMDLPQPGQVIRISSMQSDYHRAISFISLAEHFGDEQNLVESRRYLLQAERIASRFPANSVEANAIYNLVANNLIRIGDLDDAKRVTNALTNVDKQNKRIHIADSYLTQGNLREAELTIKTVNDIGFFLERKIEILLDIAERHGAQGNLQECDRLKNEAANIVIASAPNTFVKSQILLDTFFANYIQAGDVLNAEKIIKHIDVSYLSQAYERIAEAYKNIGNVYKYQYYKSLLFKYAAIEKFNDIYSHYYRKVDPNLKYVKITSAAIFGLMGMVVGAGLALLARPYMPN